MARGPWASSSPSSPWRDRCCQDPALTSTSAFAHSQPTSVGKAELFPPWWFLAKQSHLLPSIRGPAAVRRERPGQRLLSCENRPLFMSLPLSLSFPGWRGTRGWRRESRLGSGTFQTAGEPRRGGKSHSHAQVTLGIGGPGLLSVSWVTLESFIIEGAAGGQPWPFLLSRRSRWDSGMRESCAHLPEGGQEAEAEGCPQRPAWAFHFANH